MGDKKTKNKSDVSWEDLCRAIESGKPVSVAMTFTGVVSGHDDQSVEDLSGTVPSAEEVRNSVSRTDQIRWYLEGLTDVIQEMSSFGKTECYYAFPRAEADLCDKISEMLVSKGYTTVLAHPTKDGFSCDRDTLWLVVSWDKLRRIQ